ncbi:hypothetical protein TL16_g04106 [Triparma laevis f. inornata]|uniref:C2H2-type domain-containing protein n=2 Tax=Triparma laevis TaxID=1534972 RepID=A0A9W7AX25_9STRA|nr:hypothetical protein TL16_g04106 [Triparma laevis f. inornata]GMH79544.1 hypothetical protein TrLO_g6247 [Triparma laevis f. longispina]
MRPTMRPEMPIITPSGLQISPNNNPFKITSITHPSQNDVLMGRGGGTNNHAGNSRPGNNLFYDIGDRAAHDKIPQCLREGQPELRKAMGLKSTFPAPVTNGRVRVSLIQRSTGTIIWCCDMAGCEYKTKYAGNLKTHKQQVHNIDVVWHHCDSCE